MVTKAKPKNQRSGKPTGKPREPRPKQQHLLPELAPPSITEIDRQADLYRSIRDQRMEAQKGEANEAARLLELLKKHDLPFYEYDGYRVEQVSGPTKVRVRKKKDAQQENGDAEE